MRSLLLFSFLVGSVIAAANSTFSCDSSNTHCPTGACLLTKSGTCFISSCAAAGQCKNLKNCGSGVQKCCCKSSNCYKNLKIDICEDEDEEESEEKTTPKTVTKPTSKPVAPHFKNSTANKSAPATKAPSKVTPVKKTSPPKTTTTTEPPTTTEEEEESTTEEFEETTEVPTSEETTENPEDEETTTTDNEETNSKENELSKVTELEVEAESTTEETTTTEEDDEEEVSTTEEAEETTTDGSEEEKEVTTEEPEETTTEDSEEETTTVEVKPVTKPKKKSVKPSSKPSSKQASKLSSKGKKQMDDENESNEAHPVASTKDKSEEDQNDSDDDDTFMHPRSRKLPAPIHASAAKKHSAAETTTIQVTTSAMTNSKTLKEKAGSGLPWWSAVLLGLILAAAVFGGVALWLKRRKEKMAAMNANRRRSEPKKTDKLVDPLLLEKQNDSQA